MIEAINFYISSCAATLLGTLLYLTSTRSPLFFISSCVAVVLWYPIKNYRGLNPNYMGKRWAYVHFIRGAANYPIILHYEAC